MDLVLDIGNFRTKGGFFNGSGLAEQFNLPSQPFSKEALQAQLKGKKIASVLVSSVNSGAEKSACEALAELKVPYALLDRKGLALKLEVDEPEALGADRIANAYGALLHFPNNDVIAIDIGTAMTFDFVTKEGHYLGGAIAPGAALCAKALKEYTDALPLAAFEKPPSALAKTTETHIQAGIYWGLLGAIERMLFELRMAMNSPSSVHVVATGGLTRHTAFATDLEELVDLIDPNLTLIGLYEIVKETQKKEK